MKISSYLIFFCLILLSCSGSQKETDLSPARLVDPFIGTDAHGHTFPGPCLPFGMAQLSPDTRLTGWDGCSGYHYSDSVIYGFSHTHLSGTGVSDYGDILLMPGTGEPIYHNGYAQVPGQGYGRLFRKETEEAHAGYYQVLLEPGNIRVELTAGLRTGWHRYSFPPEEEAHLILDLQHRDALLDWDFRVLSDREVCGYRRSKAWAEDQRVFFVARFSAPFTLKEKEDTLQPAVFALQFGKLDSPLTVAVGISAVDEAGARNNLNLEDDGRDFDVVRTDAEQAWDAALGAIRVNGGKLEDRRTFYTALYHSMIAPNLFSDADGRYLGLDKEIHSLEKDQAQYTVFSLWDTYRAAHPLFTLIQQHRTRDFLETMLRHYQQVGKLPVWELAGNETNCMIGYHSVPIIADALLKGIPVSSKSTFLEACIASTQQEDFGIGIYGRKAFLSIEDEPESVSKTLEYAFDDWCIAMLAQNLGDTATAARFFARAQSWRHLLDPETQFFRPRQNGGWIKPFDPSEVNFHFTEANAWQYGFYVPQDVHGFMEAMGGPDSLEHRLDALFSAPEKTSGRQQADITGLIGQYAHGNEPSHHIAYLYNYAGSPWKAQDVLQQIMRDLYTDKPDGLCGNEDCGQMSAWYVFSAMGFYPLNPASGDYLIGKPFFSDIELTLESGNTFRIHTEKFGKGDYVTEMRLNGKEHSRAWITHAEILAGGELVFVMGRKEDALVMEIPPAPESPQVEIVTAPWLQQGERSFLDSTLVVLGAKEDLRIHYTLDGSIPDAKAALYSSPLLIRENTLIRFAAIRDEGAISPVVESRFGHLPAGVSARYLSPYSEMYPANAEMTLYDGIRGGRNFRTGEWQGFQEKDVEVILDLGRMVRLDSLSAGFLQDMGSWIFMPLDVSFLLSTDGGKYLEIGHIPNQVDEKATGGITQNLGLRFPAQKARYIKMLASNKGYCPEWHPGYPYQGKAWIFMDEICWKEAAP